MASISLRVSAARSDAGASSAKVGAASAVPNAAMATRAVSFFMGIPEERGRCRADRLRSAWHP